MRPGTWSKSDLEDHSQIEALYKRLGNEEEEVVIPREYFLEM